jgi:hypothetical protein
MKTDIVLPKLSQAERNIALTKVSQANKYSTSDFATIR